MKTLAALAMLVIPVLYGPIPVKTVRPYLAPVRSPQLKAWGILARETACYGIRRKAPEMYRVLYRESMFEAKAKNPKSSAAGIAQYTRGTWKDHSRRAGLPSNASPYSPKQAIRAMAWAWSQGPKGERHWRQTMDKGGSK